MLGLLEQDFRPSMLCSDCSSSKLGGSPSTRRRRSRIGPSKSVSVIISRGAALRGCGVSLAHSDARVVDAVVLRDERRAVLRLARGARAGPGSGCGDGRAVGARALVSCRSSVRVLTLLSSARAGKFRHSQCSAQLEQAFTDAQSNSSSQKSTEPVPW